MSRHIYCNTPDVETEELKYFKKAGRVEYDRWKDCFFLVTLMTLGTLLSSVLAWALHGCKEGTVPFNE
jgi:hypothetical protein